jgi:hypothetical protein
MLVDDDDILISEDASAGHLVDVVEDDDLQSDTATRSNRVHK